MLQGNGITEPQQAPVSSCSASHTGAPVRWRRMAPEIDATYRRIEALIGEISAQFGESSMSGQALG